MKNFTSGLLAGAILTTSIGTYAATNGRVIEVFDNVKRVVVNKVDKPFDKNNKPFVYNGTTYVPLRFVADALGENVNWDGKTGTVYIGESFSNNANYWEKDLTLLNSHYASCDYNNNTQIKDNQGNIYTNYLYINSYVCNYASPEGGYAEFALNGKYKAFKAELGIPEKNKNFSGNRTVKIYLDDRLVYEKTIKAGDLLTKINLDTTGANKIRFEHKVTSGSAAYTYVPVGFFNGEFIK